MEKDETEDAFTERIQSAIAGDLSFRTSSFTAADKVIFFFHLKVICKELNHNHY